MPFNRNLQLAEKTLVFGDPSAEVLSMLKSSDKDEREKGLKKILGLTLTNRDVRFANFRDALLPKPVHVLHRRQVRKLL